MHSLLKLLAQFNDVRAHLVSPPGLEAPAGITAALRRRGHEVEVFHALEDGIHHVDILYVTRTQEERFATQAEADRYRGLFRVNQPNLTTTSMEAATAATVAIVPPRPAPEHVPYCWPS